MKSVCILGSLTLLLSERDMETILPILCRTYTSNGGQLTPITFSVGNPETLEESVVKYKNWWLQAVTDQDPKEEVK